MAIPSFSLHSGNEVANRLGRLSEDIRSAFDYSVLTGKPLRMVFHLYEGKYWLETTDSQDIKLGNEKIASDPLPAEEKERQIFFDEDFTKYEDLQGEPIRDPENDDEDIPQTSPVVNAKAALRGATWYKVDSLEWSDRSLGKFLIIRDLQAEHHSQPVSIDDGRDIVGMIYFLPQGYVEKAVIHIYFSKEKGEIDQDQEPYTIVIHPYDGYAEVRGGFEEIEILHE